jgi:hypothetical protein
VSKEEKEDESVAEHVVGERQGEGAVVVENLKQKNTNEIERNIGISIEYILIRESGRGRKRQTNIERDEDKKERERLP